MIWFVYAICSKVDGRIYIGMSSNVDSRINQHNSRAVRSTKAYIPWLLIYREEIGTRIEARKREKYLKSGIGR